VVKLMEQYNISNTSATSWPYVYEGDYIVDLKFGVSISGEVSKCKARAEEAPLSTPSTPSTSGTLEIG